MTSPSTIWIPSFIWPNGVIEMVEVPANDMQAKQIVDMAEIPQLQVVHATHD